MPVSFFYGVARSFAFFLSQMKLTSYLKVLFFRKMQDPGAQAIYGRKSEPAEQPVILTSILLHKINKGYNVCFPRTTVPSEMSLWLTFTHCILNSKF